MKETQKIREEMKYIIHELMDRKISQQAIMESCSSQKNRNKILKLLEFIKDEELILTESMILICLESD